MAKEVITVSPPSSATAKRAIARFLRTPPTV